MFDLLIRNGTLIDGSGAPRRKADVGISGDRIAALGALAGAEARRTLDAAGKVVAPGFVDVHNHSDGWLLKRTHLPPKLAQGFTTEVLMADGISYAPLTPQSAPHWLLYLRALNGLQQADYRGWRSIGEYLDLIAGKNVQNAIAHVPYANVRTKARGWGRAAPDDTQIQRMQAEVRRGMEEGAVGVSTGLDYVAQCFAGTDELAEVCAAAAAWQGLYVTHIRYKKGHLAGLKEAVEIARRAGLALHVSHLKGESDSQNEELLEYLDQTAAKEVDLTFDVYPYGPSSTMLHSLLPYEVWEDGVLGVPAKLSDPELRARFGEQLAGYRLGMDEITIAWTATKENARYEGLSLAAYAERVDKPLPDALCDLLIEEQLAVLMVLHRGEDRLAEPFLAHPKCMLGTDGIYFPDGRIHPRVYGSAARLLGEWVRERKRLSLEEAVRKLSGLPAGRFGLKERGVLREGAFADVVILDPEAVRARSTFEDPHRLAEGVSRVLVNGVPVWENGRLAEGLGERLPGRRLFYKR